MRIYRRVAVLNTGTNIRHILVSLPFVSIMRDEVQPEESAAEPPWQPKPTHYGKLCPRHPEAAGQRIKANRYRQNVCVRCWQEEVGQRRRLNGANHAQKLRKAAG